MRSFYVELRDGFVACVNIYVGNDKIIGPPVSRQFKIFKYCFTILVFGTQFYCTKSH